MLVLGAGFGGLTFCQSCRHPTAKVTVVDRTNHHFIHLIFLIGFRNKLFVLMQWAYSYFAYKRSARIITYLPPE